MMVVLVVVGGNTFIFIKINCNLLYLCIFSKCCLFSFLHTNHQEDNVRSFRPPLLACCKSSLPVSFAHNF